MNPRDKARFPDSNEDIKVERYHRLVLKVFGYMVKKFGPWILRYKEDLVQTGYIGLLKAKEKYTPGRGSFLGLAYLRITSAMQNDIARYAKYEANTTPIENLKFLSDNPDKHKLLWDDLFSDEIVNYDAVLRMVRDEDDRNVLHGIIEMYPYWKLRAILKETKEEHESRVASIKEELRELLGLFHPSA